MLTMITVYTVVNAPIYRNSYQYDYCIGVGLSGFQVTVDKPIKSLSKDEDNGNDGARKQCSDWMNEEK